MGSGPNSRPGGGRPNGRDSPVGRLLQGRADNRGTPGRGLRGGEIYLGGHLA